MKISYDATDYITPEIMGEIKKRERDTAVFMWLKAFKNMPDEDKSVCITHFVNEAKGILDILLKFYEQDDAVVSSAALKGLDDLAKDIASILLRTHY